MLIVVLYDFLTELQTYVLLQYVVLENKHVAVSKLYHTYLLHAIDEVDRQQHSSSPAAEPG